MKATEDVIEAAEAAIEQGAFQEAVQVLTAAISAGDDSSLLLLLRGQARLKADDPAGALQDLDLCILKDPWFPEAYISRGRCYQALQDFHHAVNEFNKGMQITEQPDAQLFFELGDCSAAIQENSKAAAFFQKAIDAEPSYAIAHWRLADVLAAMGDEEAAAKSYARVCQTDTQVHLRYLQIAEQDMEGGNWGEAIRTLDAVEKIQPGDFRVFWHRANAHINHSPPDFEKALSDISMCIELDPLRQDKVFMVRGRCSIEMGDWASAQQDVTRFLEKEPDSIEGRLLRAKLSIKDTTHQFVGGTLSRLKAASSRLASCEAHAQEHHASQKEEDDAKAALAEAETLVSELRAKQADEVSKRRRAVMDYDHVVKMKPGISLVKSVDSEADFCIAKTLCYEKGFESNSEAIKEACDAFLRAWNRGITQPLQNCVELVVAEKLLELSRQPAPPQESSQEEAAASQPRSLRALCASKLVESGKYGGRKLPAHFHLALARHYLTQTRGEAWRRCARHLTMAWCGGGNLQNDLGFCAYAIYMARKEMMVGGPSLISACMDKIVADTEAFPATIEFVENLREQVAEDGGGGKKKKK
eukprot:TRINITY_DN6353_c0_g1_i12.p1 TRINITY_DN6353_c0_g1~~TRINITY_DN6353_c0_g1_i12.p1  ORF type:complete len:587 (+),score=124.55 TRINITY_DN6353_c0_g1_i12:192-1952(+)